jgi:doublecortin-like kinase 3
VELKEDYEHKGMKYYISEYIEPDLQSLMDAKPAGVLDLPEALELYASLLKALSEFHRQKVVLRVLKASKLRVKKAEVYFYDLSEAQTIKRKQKLFAENYFNPFIAPESFAEDGYGPEVDVWASGVLLFYLLTRRFPFEAKNTKQCYEEEFHLKCGNGFNFPQVLDQMGIKVSSSIKNKFGLV